MPQPDDRLTLDALRLDPDEAVDEIVERLGEVVSRNLRKRGALVGVSGGIDSSVTAALCVRALGPGKVMALLMPAAMLATLPVLYLSYRRRPGAFYPTLAGLALFVVALLITLLVEVPLDNQFAEWTVTTLPANWEQLRDRWELFHVIRSWVSVAGLALLLAGALFWRNDT